jgi:CheY-like chemotaxis protein
MALGVDALSRLRAGIAAAQGGDPAAAQRMLRALVAEEPDKEAAWLALASVLEAPRDGLDCLRRALEINPGNGRTREALIAALLQAGLAALEANQADEARQLLVELTQQDPGHEEGWGGPGPVAADPPEARRALEINPRNERAREEVKRLHALLASPGPVWECPLCFAGAAEPSPTCPSCRAVVCLTELDALFGPARAEPAVMQRAVEHYEGVLARGPTFEGHLALGMAYANLRQWGPASECFQAALRKRAADRVIRRQVNAFLNRAAVLSAAGEDEPPARRGLLLVDTDAGLRQTARGLAEHGYEVVTAPDGYEAIDCLRRIRPALILLAIDLPGLDGYEICKLVREHPPTERVPVVLLSDRRGLSLRLRARLVGARAVISRPPDAHRLHQIVERYGQSP